MEQMQFDRRQCELKADALEHVSQYLDACQTQLFGELESKLPSSECLAMGNDQLASEYRRLCDQFMKIDERRKREHERHDREMTTLLSSMADLRGRLASLRRQWCERQHGDKHDFVRPNSQRPSSNMRVCRRCNYLVY